MHVQARRAKENMGRAAANSVVQDTSNVRQDFGITDNRPGVIAQRKLIANGALLQKTSVSDDSGSVYHASEHLLNHTPDVIQQLRDTQTQSASRKRTIAQEIPLTPVQRYVAPDESAIGKRVQITNPVADDFGSTGTVVRLSSHAPNTLVVVFDDEPQTQYRVAPEEVDSEESVRARTEFWDWRKETDSRAPQKTGKDDPLPGYARGLVKGVKEEDTIGKKEWAKAFKTTLWKGKDKEAKLFGPNFLTRQVEADAYALCRSASIPIVLWEEGGAIEADILKKRGIPEAKKPDYRINDRPADAFRVTMAEDAQQAAKAIMDNIGRKRTKYGDGCVWVAVITAHIPPTLRQIVELLAPQLTGSETLLLVINGVVHCIGAGI